MRWWSLQERSITPYDIWQALLKIDDHINTLHVDPVEQRVLQEGVETLALNLAEASNGIIFVILSEAD